MSTERDEHGIYHIDGPPVRGFVIAEHPDGSGNRVEVVYRVLGYYGTKAECEEAQKSLFNLFKSELRDLMAAQKPPAGCMHPTDPIIWWRVRPEIIPFENGLWQFYARFATSPPLSEEMWDRWGVKEGENYRPAKEVVG